VVGGLERKMGRFGPPFIRNRTPLLVVWQKFGSRVGRSCDQTSASAQQVPKFALQDPKKSDRQRYVTLMNKIKDAMGCSRVNQNI
jgi:hypothetical protein